MSSIRREALVRAASAAQPAPGGGGRTVFNVASQFVSFDDDLVEALHARSEKGAAKYSQPLKTLDGRNSRHEQLQKALDGFVYSVKDHLEGPGSLSVVAAWLRVVFELVDVVASERPWTSEAAAVELQSLGMTSDQIATALGVHPVTVRRWRQE